MEEDIIKKIVHETTKEAVHETLKGLGFDTKSPHEVQSDLLYLRKVRKGSEFISLRVKASTIALLVPTILYIMWEAIKQSVTK